MEKLVIKKGHVETLLENKFLKVFDFRYKEGAHYYVASRRNQDELLATKNDEEFRASTADAVTCCVIIKMGMQEPVLLLDYEYRYPVGRYLLSPTAGLIDKEDIESGNPLISASTREIFEETGLKIKDNDELFVVSDLLLSSPGMTDESNALVCAVINVENTCCLTQEGACGCEMFNGFRMLNKAEAREIFEKGSDLDGTYFSVYTWAVISYFLSGAWENHKK